MSDNLDNLNNFKKYKGVLFKALEMEETTGDIITVEVDGERVTYSPQDYACFDSLWSKPFNDYLKEQTGAETEKDAFVPEAKKILNNLLQGKGELFIESNTFNKYYDKTIGFIVMAGELEKEKNRKSERTGLIVGGTTLLAGLCLFGALAYHFGNSVAEKIKKMPARQEQKENTSQPTIEVQNKSIDSDIVQKTEANANPTNNVSTNNLVQVQKPIKKAPERVLLIFILHRAFPSCAKFPERRRFLPSYR